MPRGVYIRKSFTIEHRRKLSLSKIGNQNGKGNLGVIAKKRKDYTEFYKKAGQRWLGRNNPNFKHGLSKDNKRHYNDFRYKNWRRNVYKRDNYICQDCKQIGGYLTAHHIKSWARYPELRYELFNGITLCEPCHKKTDNYRGRGKKRHEYN